MVRSDRASTPLKGPWRLLVLLALGLSLTACASSPPGKTAFFWPVGRSYQVRPGDTLSQIAASFHIPYATLAAYNRVLSPSRIYPGEVLRIPPAGYVPGAPAAPALQVAGVVPTPRPRLRLALLSPSASPVARPAMRQAAFAPQRAQPIVPAGPAPTQLAARSASPRPLLPLASAPTRVAEQVRVPRSLLSPPAPRVADGAPRFLWPVSGKVIEAFGALPNGGRNDGINIATREGAPIRAAASGTVIYAGDGLKAYGNLVLIRHRDGYITAYAHAERLLVARNAHVEAGQVIGYAGTTGGLEEPQLHFEIRHGSTPLNPAPLLVASASS